MPICAKADLSAVAAQAGLDAVSCKTSQSIDRPGLALHAQSLAAKRAKGLSEQAQARF